MESYKAYSNINEIKLPIWEDNEKRWNHFIDIDNAINSLYGTRQSFLYLIQINDYFTKFGYSSHVYNRLVQHRKKLLEKKRVSGSVKVMQVPCLRVDDEIRMHNVLSSVLIEQFNTYQNYSIYDTETYPVKIETMEWIVGFMADYVKNNYIEVYQNLSNNLLEFN